MNGKPQPFDKPHLKIMNATHFAVVEQLSDSVLSATDSTGTSRQVLVTSSNNLLYT